MKTKKMQILMAAFVVASAGFLGACASVGDADQWFVLGEQTLQLAGLPDAAVGGGQAQVPLHGINPFNRSAAR